MAAPTVPGTIVPVHRNQPRCNHTLGSLRLSPVVRISLQKELNLARTVGIFLILSFIFIFWTILCLVPEPQKLKGFGPGAGQGLGNSGSGKKSQS
jgi:hypothetical protein